VIRSLHNTRKYKIGFGVFAGVYFIFLFAPLVMVSILAFNDSMFPSLPWYGFTLDWFIGKGPKKVGLFYNPMNMNAILTSLRVALGVSLLSTFVGTCAAFLFDAWRRGADFACAWLARFFARRAAAMVCLVLGSISVQSTLRAIGIVAL